MKYLFNVLLTMVVFCQLACNDDSSDPKDTTHGIELTFIAEEIPSGNLVVENFSLLSVEVSENNNKSYYEFVYSFDIRNTGSQPFELQDLSVQNIIIDGTATYGAAGSILPGGTIAPGAKHKVSYSANSSQLQDGLAVNGLTLRIEVKESNVPIITQNYLINKAN